jgi:hypothetical protein
MISTGVSPPKCRKVVELQGRSSQQHRGDGIRSGCPAPNTSLIMIDQSVRYGPLAGLSPTTAPDENPYAEGRSVVNLGATQAKPGPADPAAKIRVRHKGCRERMRNSDRAWLALAAGVAAYDLIATDDEQPSNGGPSALALSAGRYWIDDPDNRPASDRRLTAVVRPVRAVIRRRSTATAAERSAGATADCGEPAMTQGGVTHLQPYRGLSQKIHS